MSYIFSKHLRNEYSITTSVGYKHVEISHIFEFSETAFRLIFRRNIPWKIIDIKSVYLNFGEISNHKNKKEKIDTTCATVINLQLEELIRNRNSIFASIIGIGSF